MNSHDRQREIPVILIAEDDPDDRLLIERAFQESGLSGTFLFTKDGEELLDYLFGRKQFAANGPNRPDCILLDLNMPRKDGREALWEIRQNPEYSNLPIIVLSTSDSENDKEYCNELGIIDYITKPDSFAGLLVLMEKVKGVCLPSREKT